MKLVVAEPETNPRFAKGPKNYPAMMSELNYPRSLSSVKLGLNLPMVWRCLSLEWTCIEDSSSEMSPESASREMRPDSASREALLKDRWWLLEVMCLSQLLCELFCLNVTPLREVICGNNLNCLFRVAHQTFPSVAFSCG